MTFKSQLTTLALAPQHCIIVKECIESTITHYFLFIKGFIINFLRPRNTIKYLQNLDTEKNWWWGRLSFHRTFGKQVFTDWDQAKCSNNIFLLSFYRYTKIVIWINVLQKKLTDTIFEVKKARQINDAGCRILKLWCEQEHRMLFYLFWKHVSLGFTK